MENKSKPNINKLEGICQHISQREKKAQKAERDSIKYMQCKYLEDKVGKIYKGMVTSVSDFGLFVSITENSCDGFVRLSEIGGDDFTADMANYCINGSNTGEKIRLGDVVSVVIKSVDVEKKNINLTLLRV